MRSSVSQDAHGTRVTLTLAPPAALQVSYLYDRGLTRLRGFQKQGINVITPDRSADGQIVFGEQYADKTRAVGTERIPCEQGMVRHCSHSTLDSRCWQNCWHGWYHRTLVISRVQHRLQREARLYAGFHSTMELKSADLASWEGQVVRGRINSGRVLNDWTAKSTPK